MRHFLIASALVLSCNLASFPQDNKCKLTIDQAPELRGFKLGMAYQDAIKGIPEYAQGEPDRLGVQTVNLLQPSTGAQLVTLKFLDSRITSIEVIYDRSVRWDSAEQFLSRVAEGLGMKDKWNRNIGREGGRIECNGFILEATYSSGIMPSVYMFDPSAPEIIKKRREAKEEGERRTFKP